MDERLLKALMSSPSVMVDKVPTDNAKRKFLDIHGELKCVPIADVHSIDIMELKNFMMEQGLYVMPTIELAETLRELIEGYQASNPLEIGAGNGAISRYLGIRAVDNYMQTPDWQPASAKDRKWYKETSGLYLNQGRVQYGSNVLKIDGEEAVKRFKPDFLIGLYLTHKYDKNLPERGGNSFGVSFAKILKTKSVKQMAFVGNFATHKDHTLLCDFAPRDYQVDSIVTRAANPEETRLFMWDKIGEYDISDGIIIKS